MRNFRLALLIFADSCSSPILEPERSALLQEALADSKLQAVKSQLESRGLRLLGKRLTEGKLRVLQELGDFGGGWGSYTVIEGGRYSEICTSQWGYSYSCYSTAPALSLASTSLQQATFTGHRSRRSR